MGPAKVMMYYSQLLASSALRCGSTGRRSGLVGGAGVNAVKLFRDRRARRSEGAGVDAGHLDDLLSDIDYSTPKKNVKRFNTKINFVDRYTKIMA